MVVLGHEPTDLVRARCVQVEDRIHEIDRVNVLLQPKQNFFLDAVEIESPVPYRQILVVKAEIAGENATSLGFKADNSPFMVPVSDDMRRRNIVEVLYDGGISGFEDLPRAPKGNSLYQTHVAARP